MKKYIELTININEQVKDDILLKKEVSYKRTTTMNNKTIVLDISSSAMESGKVSEYNLDITIIDSVINKTSDDKKHINNYSQNFSSFNDICHFIRISFVDDEADVTYVVNIEVEYNDNKYFNFFNDLTNGYVNKTRILDYMRRTDFKNTKNLIKICHLIILYNYYFIDEELKFILNKFYYYGFEETEKPYTKKKLFKNEKQLLEVFVSNAIKTLKIDTSFGSIEKRKELLNSIYEDSSNEIFFDKLMI